MGFRSQFAQTANLSKCDEYRRKHNLVHSGRLRIVLFRGMTMIMIIHFIMFGSLFHCFSRSLKILHQRRHKRPFRAFRQLGSAPRADVMTFPAGAQGPEARSEFALAAKGGKAQQACAETHARV